MNGNWITHHKDACNYLMVSDIKVADYLSDKKPSFGDQKPKVVTLFEQPEFMSILSNKTLQEISNLDTTAYTRSTSPLGVGKGNIQRLKRAGIFTFTTHSTCPLHS